MEQLWKITVKKYTDIRYLFPVVGPTPPPPPQLKQWSWQKPYLQSLSLFLCLAGKGFASIGYKRGLEVKPLFQLQQALVLYVYSTPLSTH